MPLDWLKVPVPSQWSRTLVLSTLSVPPERLKVPLEPPLPQWLSRKEVPVPTLLTVPVMVRVPPDWLMTVVLPDWLAPMMPLRVTLPPVMARVPVRRSVRSPVATTVPPEIVTRPPLST